MREQYSTLHGIINSANALIFSIDRDYRYTSFNQGHAAAMKAIYGAEIRPGHSLLDYMTAAENGKPPNVTWIERSTERCLWKSPILERNGGRENIFRYHTAPSGVMERLLALPYLPGILPKKAG